MATSYYKEKLRQGDTFAAHVAEKLLGFGLVVGLYQTQSEQYEIGESRMGLEIKFDDRLASTSNLYFEMYEKTKAGNAHWVEAGILRVDNSLLYGIGNHNEFYIFGKQTLGRVYEAFDRGLVPPPADKDFKRRETPTSRGFTLPREVVISWAEQVFKAKPDGTWFDPIAASRSFRIDDLRLPKKTAER